ncbi:centrosomal protein of 44 kda [Cystoisospora suis]|uniref:Centrosomal protein of 44 kDa n=1 Tax=Cystoisospora suis TaxID=483139 RepID=A0A2C6L999_9APIC|nr:centrosomal protein of 44 kda [Cystoisospora suis]
MLPSPSSSARAHLPYPCCPEPLCTSPPPGCSPGDLPGSIKSLRSALRRMRYPPALESHGSAGSLSRGGGVLDDATLATGSVTAFLSILHFLCLQLSEGVWKAFHDRGYDLLYKTDQRFVQTLWKFLRDECLYRPALTVSQFLTPSGFAERKIHFCLDLIHILRQIHNQHAQAQKLRNARRSPQQDAPGNTSSHSDEENTRPTQPLAHRSQSQTTTRRNSKSFSSTKTGVAGKNEESLSCSPVVCLRTGAPLYTLSERPETPRLFPDRREHGQGTHDVLEGEAVSRRSRSPSPQHRKQEHSPLRPERRLGGSSCPPRDGVTGNTSPRRGSGGQGTPSDQHTASTQGAKRGLSSSPSGALDKPHEHPHLAQPALSLPSQKGGVHEGMGDAVLMESCQQLPCGLPDPGEQQNIEELEEAARTAQMLQLLMEQVTSLSSKVGAFSQRVASSVDELHMQIQLLQTRLAIVEKRLESSSGPFRGEQSSRDLGSPSGCSSGGIDRATLHPVSLCSSTVPAQGIPVPGSYGSVNNSCPSGYFPCPAGAASFSSGQCDNFRVCISGNQDGRGAGLCEPKIHQGQSPNPLTGADPRAAWSGTPRAAPLASGTTASSSALETLSPTTCVRGPSPDGVATVGETEQSGLRRAHEAEYRARSNPGGAEFKSRPGSADLSRQEDAHACQSTRVLLDPIDVQMQQDALRITEKINSLQAILRRSVAGTSQSSSASACVSRARGGAGDSTPRPGESSQSGKLPTQGRDVNATRVFPTIPAQWTVSSRQDPFMSNTHSSTLKSPLSASPAGTEWPRTAGCNSDTNGSFACSPPTACMTECSSRGHTWSGRNVAGEVACFDSSAPAVPPSFAAASSPTCSTLATRAREGKAGKEHGSGVTLPVLKHDSSIRTGLNGQPKITPDETKSVSLGLAQTDRDPFDPEKELSWPSPVDRQEAQHRTPLFGLSCSSDGTVSEVLESSIGPLSSPNASPQRGLAPCQPSLLESFSNSGAVPPNGSNFSATRHGG